MKKDKVKYNFAVKSKEELDRLSREELLNYVKNLQDNLIQEKPPKNSNNSSIPSFLATIAVEKFEDAMPLDRQVKKYKKRFGGDSLTGV